jgi:hypothetical protein
LVVILGRRFAQGQFLISLGFGAVVLLVLATKGTNGQSLWVLLGLPALIPGVLAGLTLHRLKTAAEFGLALKRSALVVVLYGLLVSIGLVL